MGLFDSLFKRNKNNQPTGQVTPSYAPTQPTVNMGGYDNGPVLNSLNLSKGELIKSLDLRKDVINSICLDKSQLNNLTARVAVVLDHSISMEDEYKYGHIQTFLDRLLILAMKIDDNGELDLWLFHNNAIRLDGITTDNFYDYIRKSGIMKKYEMYGTEYAPVMRDVAKKYMKEEPSNMPNLVIFITDGDCSDRSQAKKMMKETSGMPIFWQFVGIGNDNFQFLKSLDKMNGRVIDNANFFSVNDLMKMSDGELYNRLLAEYPDWITKAKSAKILK